jgi:very-short-patch-repair endonuclease
LCIEADGGIHNEKDIKAYDIERTKVLNESGISVLRFTNKAIIETIDDVLNQIEEFVKNRTI